MKKQKYAVGIAGATGLVGREMLKVLEDRDFPVSKVRVFASENSLGDTIPFRDEELKVEVLGEKSFAARDLDFVLFATSAELSEKYVPLAAASGAIAIDNSSFFRMKAEIPLVVPEVNPGRIDLAKTKKIIANPNCSTIQLVACLKPLHEEGGIKRVVMSSYQSVSGAGSDALDELQSQVGKLFANEDFEPKVFPHQIAFNCIPQVDKFLPSGFTKEEAKIIEETRKILDLPKLKITATAVRVPTLISHAESVNIEFENDISPEDAREILTNAGIIVLDEPEKNLYPLGFEVTGRDEVFVGRIRRDESVDFGLHLWIVADNLRKGAATNAVQIAELCCERQFVAAAAS